MKTKVKDWYLRKYTDKEGEKINPRATFGGLLGAMCDGKEPYEYLGVSDSLIRERVFTKLAELLRQPYDYVYNLWLEI